MGTLSAANAYRLTENLQKINANAEIHEYFDENRSQTNHRMTRKFAPKRVVPVPQVVVDMKQPQIRQLATQLRFAPEEGRIWMDERRMVLVHSETFADLRDELLSTLGYEMTRGLLTRIYFAAGQRDAASVIKKLGTGASLKEILETGGRMHALQGYLLPEHVGRGLAAHDVRSDDYYGEALWKDSLEDEAHVARHGVGQHAVCWNAIGYCSGYLSYCAQRTIVVREVECRATGATHCKIIARPAARWDNVEEDLRFLLPQRKRTQPIRNAPAQTSTFPIEAEAVPADAPPDPGFVGISTAFSVLQHKINRVAPTQATVLLLGESGVGKSLIARQVHQRSKRAQEQFIEVNCAAIPETLVESELFGVERGAFSGAHHTRAGRFEAAQGGTLFLDEIATLSLTTQGKLLRVLQSGALERLGSTQTRVVDVRVIAATNENLKQAVQEGRFREDLYFRLNVFPVVVPPLRQRRDDIPLLVQALLQRLAVLHERGRVDITSRALQALIHHDWPGNIRELENVIERAVIILDEGEMLDLQHLSNADDTLSTPSYFGLDASGQLRLNVDYEFGVSELPVAVDETHDEQVDLDEIAHALLERGPGQLAILETALLRLALQKTRGNITRAAALLGLSRAQLEYRQKKLLRPKTANRKPVP